VRARWQRLALAAIALTLLGGAAGCGGVGVSTASDIPGDDLTVYSSLPLQGETSASSAQIVNGEKLALAQAGGHVGRFRVSYDSLDDSNPTTGEWAPGVTATNAKIAAQDTSTIAYLGDYDSAATAISLPVMNAAGILQVSPASPYEGLTSARDAGQDEPDRFYLTGRRNFGRLMPADAVQAAAQVKLMRELGIGKVYVLQDQDPFDAPLAALVAEDAKQAGIEVVAEAEVDTVDTTEFDAPVAKVLESGAQAIFFSGHPNAGAQALWQQLHTANRQLALLGGSELASVAFAKGIGAAGSATYLGAPVLPVGLYPPAARPVLRAYRSQFHEAPSGYALYGYEAMSVVLLAIQRAGVHGGDREAVVKRFFGIRNRDSVLGRYSIQSDGDSTLTRYGVDRVARGRLVFDRALQG
jgi:branched-chain amino acid transport system substrate-binding protein